LVSELETLPAVRWLKAHAPRASVAARCANIPSVHLAVKSGAGLAPLPTVYAAGDADLVNLFGALPELNYPIFLVAHRDMRNHPRVSAFFEFCVHELKPVLLRRWGTSPPCIQNDREYGKWGGGAGFASTAMALLGDLPGRRRIGTGVAMRLKRMAMARIGQHVPSIGRPDN
jgi:hypothetical protein